MTREEIREEAARWFTRLQSTERPLEETFAEWQHWMSLDSRHAEAFQELEETWHRFAVLPRPALLSRDLLETDAYDASITVNEWNARRTRATLRRRSVVFGLAASVVVAVAGLSVLVAVRASGVEVIETRIGENRTITLSDGSHVSMGGASRIEARLDPRRRDVKLMRGEALFTVAKDTSRPFSVHAGPATVTAVGTEFNVRRSADRVVVSVLEGRVRIQPVRALVPLAWVEEVVPSVRRGEAAEVDAKHRTLVDDNGLGATAALPDTAAATAWQSGQLSFDDEPLRYVVDVVNRYSRKQIVIADPAIEDVRVSGTVLGDHVQGWVASLDAAFGVRAVEDDDNIVLRRK